MSATVTLAEPDLQRQVSALLPDLRAFARFLIRDRIAADDLVQDAVVRALTALDQFQPGTNLKAWLFTILRNHFYEQTRRRKREARAMLAFSDEDGPCNPEQHARAELQDLQRVIFELPPLQREALILIGAQGLTHEEAAAICGVPEGTMKARLSRARAALSQKMTIAVT